MEVGNQTREVKTLKKRFTTELVFVALKLDRKMRTEVDVSDYAIGGVLSMEFDDG